ncbi:amidohydrolase family protein [Nonomuraea candida]|uniref:amidohydrolase family protein n=1 Tax=Nonomuraea candida TaxID=359159 RepID=UPI0005BBAFF9|nr:amidohydrolase family protein [Nonomuraea candida]
MKGFTRRRFIQTVAVTGAAAGAAPAAPAAGAAATRPEALTLTGLTNGTVAASPAADRLIVEAQGILWSLPRTGGTARALTSPDLEPTRPTWSPDGSAVAMCAYRGGGFHIWTMAPDGSGLRRLTDGPWDDRGVSWSPDGSRIAFASERGGDPAAGSFYHVWTVEVRTGRLTQLTDGPQNDYDPAWSSDGRILFVRADAAGGRTIAAVPGSGGAVSVVRTVDTGSVVCPAVSPDGSRVAYVHLTTDENGPVATLIVDGAPVTAGEDVFAVPPAWLSADELLYLADGQIRTRRVTASGAAAAIPFTAALKVSRPAYRRKKYDFRSTGPRAVRGVNQPVLAPDGRSVAFTALNALWVMRLGETPRKLVQADPEHYVQGPAWTPDGRGLLYCSDKEGLNAVYRHDLADGTETTLASGGRVNPAVSPDGARLACHDMSGNLLVRDLATGEERTLAAPLGGGGLPGPPSWSPDGRYLASADRNRLTARFREGYNLIRVVDTRTTGQAVLYAPLGHTSLSDRHASGPVWSPDGRWMAFVAESALWVLPVRADGSPAGPARRITDESADFPSWSGDSRSILYLSGGTLRLIRPDGHGRRTLPTRLRYRRRAPAPSTVTRIHAGRLWDGTGERVRQDVDILVRGNTIVGVEAHRPPRAGERLIDARAHTVLPGLWDSHVHPWNPTYGNRQNLANLAYGITSAVSLGGFAYEGVHIREALAAGRLAGPRLFATGELIDGDRVAYSMGRAHRTRDGLRRTLDRAVALDFDFVKTYVRAPGWIMAEGARVAHSELGVLAGSHLAYPGINVGQDLTTHLQATQRLEQGHQVSMMGRAYQDVEEIYRQPGFHLVATPFSALQLLGAAPALADDPRVAALLPPWDVALVRTTAAEAPTRAELVRIETEVEVYKRMLRDEAGGIVLGTDSPLYPVGLHLHLGLRALHMYGVTPLQALRMVTVLPARVFGVGDQLGTVEPGKLADLTFVAGDPFTDFDSLVDTPMTMCDGVLYRQEDLVGKRPPAVAPAVAQTDWLETSRAMRRDGCCSDHGG